MTRSELVVFLRKYTLAVEATIAPGGGPQAAVIGFGVSDQCELVFDALDETRKCQNLHRDPRIALVVGWEHEITAQIEGVADFPTGAELERLRQVYFTAFPDGRERLSWPGIRHVRVRPTWVRYTDFTKSPLAPIELGPETFR